MALENKRTRGDPRSVSENIFCLLDGYSYHRQRLLDHLLALAEKQPLDPAAQTKTHLWVIRNHAGNIVDAMQCSGERLKSLLKGRIASEDAIWFVPDYSSGTCPFSLEQLSGSNCVFFKDHAYNKASLEEALRGTVMKALPLRLHTGEVLKASAASSWSFYSYHGKAPEPYCLTLGGAENHAQVAAMTTVRIPNFVDPRQIRYPFFDKSKVQKLRRQTQRAVAATLHRANTQEDLLDLDRIEKALSELGVAGVSREDRHLVVENITVLGAQLFPFHGKSPNGGNLIFRNVCFKGCLLGDVREDSACLCGVKFHGCRFKRCVFQHEGRAAVNRLDLASSHCTVPYLVVQDLLFTVSDGDTNEVVRLQCTRGHVFRVTHEWNEAFRRAACVSLAAYSPIPIIVCNSVENASAKVAEAGYEPAY